VDDPAPMGGRQRLRHFPGDAQRLLDARAAAREPLGQRLSREQFHDQEMDGARVTDVEERANARVGQAGDRPRLLVEAAEQVGVTGEIGPHDLESDLAVEPRVAGAVNFTHTTRTERRDDLVGPQCQPRAQHGALRSVHGHTETAARAPGHGDDPVPRPEADVIVTSAPPAS
jgi:hypothetical protein